MRCTAVSVYSNSVFVSPGTIGRRHIPLFRVPIQVTTKVILSILVVHDADILFFILGRLLGEFVPVSSCYTIIAIVIVVVVIVVRRRTARDTSLPSCPTQSQFSSF